MENKILHLRIVFLLLILSSNSWAQQQPMFEAKAGIGLRSAIPYRNIVQSNSTDNHVLETNLKIQLEVLLQKRFNEKLFMQVGYGYCGSGYQYNFMYNNNQNEVINTYKLYISSDKALLRFGCAITPRIESIFGVGLNFHHHTLTEFLSTSTGPDSIASQFIVNSTVKDFISLSNSIGLNFLVSKRINILLQAEMDWGTFPAFDLTTNLSGKSGFKQAYSYSSQPKFLFFSVGCYYALYRSKH